MDVAPDLQDQFQTVVTQTVIGNIVSVCEQLKAKNDPALVGIDEDVTRAAMMGGLAAIVSVWFGKAHQANELALAREALNAAIDRYWGQMVVGSMTGEKAIASDPTT